MCLSELPESGQQAGEIQREQGVYSKIEKDLPHSGSALGCGRALV